MFLVLAAFVSWVCMFQVPQFVSEIVEFLSFSIFLLNLFDTFVCFWFYIIPVFVAYLPMAAGGIHVKITLQTLFITFKTQFSHSVTRSFVLKKFALNTRKSNGLARHLQAPDLQ